MTARLVACAVALVIAWMPASPSLAGDLDGDGVEDAADPCPGYANENPADTDGDGIPNACQCGDADGDGAITAMDVHHLMLCLTSPPCPVDVGLADANNSGTLSMEDLALVGRVADGVASVATLSCARRP